MTIYTVKYTSTKGDLLSCLPTQDRDEANSLRDRINGERPSAYAYTETKEVAELIIEMPKCLKCGTTKVSDLFKGIYCPRCNDWV